MVLAAVQFYVGHPLGPRESGKVIYREGQPPIVPDYTPGFNARRYGLQIICKSFTLSYLLKHARFN
jgi:hypothetical protein